jgi:hypothetical protein
MSALFLNTSTASTNTKGASSPRTQYNPDQTSILLSNFYYGYNGTVTPNGDNMFVGGAGNTTMGATATQTTDSSENSGFGRYACASVTTGYDNTAMGVSALGNVTTGNDNTGVGHGAGGRITTGQYNTAIGALALDGTTTGNRNIGIGLQAGYFIADGATKNLNPTYGVYIGYNTKANADGATNEIVIGYNSTGLGSNTTSIGSSGTTLTKLFGAVNSTSYTVATLPSAATSGAGARSFVTDANATMTAGIGTTVAAGGSNKVPVYSDGTNWIIG